MARSSRRSRNNDENERPRNSRTKGGNKSSGGSRRRKKKEYVEEAGWATGFQREDNRPPQPQYTGEGMLDDDLCDAIMEDGGKFQIAIWTRDSDGDPLRNRNGSLRCRIHIEPVYKPDDEDDDDEDDDEEEDRYQNTDDDIPF